MKRISRSLEIFNNLARALQVTGKKKPERESMDYLLEIASYLEVSCMTPTEGATV